jgi:hypothetical protein
MAILDPTVLWAALIDKRSELAEELRPSWAVVPGPQAQSIDPSTVALHAGAPFWIKPLGLDNRGLIRTLVLTN